MKLWRQKRDRLLPYFSCSPFQSLGRDVLCEDREPPSRAEEALQLPPDTH